MHDGPGTRDGAEQGHAGSHYPVALVAIERLLPTELHCADSASALAESIDRAGCWTAPLLVERDRLFVMDGHHRLAAARRLALDFLPCVLLTYADPRVELSAWSEARPVAEGDIVLAATSGRLLPLKTTRHRLVPEVGTIRIALSRLRK